MSSQADTIIGKVGFFLLQLGSYLVKADLTEEISLRENLVFLLFCYLEFLSMFFISVALLRVCCLCLRY